MAILINRVYFYGVIFITTTTMTIKTESYCGIMENNHFSISFSLNSIFFYVVVALLRASSFLSVSSKLRLTGFLVFITVEN